MSSAHSSSPWSTTGLTSSRLEGGGGVRGRDGAEDLWDEVRGWHGGAGVEGAGFDLGVLPLDGPVRAAEDRLTGVREGPAAAGGILQPFSC